MANDYQDIPDLMKSAKRWLLWGDGKVPFWVNGRHRSGKLDTPQDQSNLGTFDEAFAALNQDPNYKGLGFALGPDGTGNYWQGIDLDDVADHPGLDLIKEELPGYTELSPSGTGYHAIGYGRKFTSFNKSQSHGIEAYGSAKYFTVTGEGAGLGEPVCLAEYVENVLMPMIGMEPAKKPGDGSSKDHGGKKFRKADPSAIRDLRSALNNLRADDRDVWVAVGQNLFELGDAGRELWLTWSQTSEKFDPSDASSRWDTFTGTASGYEAVFAKAQAAGWVNPASNLSTESRLQGPEIWPEPVDLFVDRPVPLFPLEVLPDVFVNFCREKSKQSGFDPGAYAFGLLIAASATLDMRSTIDVGAFKSPGFLWGGLIGPSGFGKSPVLSDCMRSLKLINSEIETQSMKDLEEHQLLCDGIKDKTLHPPRPPYRQAIVNDTTVEALAVVLNQNPRGVILHSDEMTEWLGRMDAYGSGGGGKDRGAYIRAYEGDSVTINRVRSSIPLRVDRFSVGILTGVQPEKLSDRFARSGEGTSDGLFQRFLLYRMKESTDANFSEALGQFTESNVTTAFSRLFDLKYQSFVLSDTARFELNDYVNHIRRLAKSTPGGRFAEHINKFTGFAVRIALTLHGLHQVTLPQDGGISIKVTKDFLANAQRVLSVLYRHSEATYGEIERQSGEALSLVRSAGEAILSKHWKEFDRGDLTRNATNWQGSDQRLAEHAIDLLIELGWVADITPLKRGVGRKSQGRFLVNPAVHDRFVGRATEVTNRRADRYAAIRQVCAA